MKTETEKQAINWIDNLVKCKGIKETTNILRYNVEHNQYFKQSNNWITAAWNRLNELNPS